MRCEVHRALAFEGDARGRRSRRHRGRGRRSPPADACSRVPRAVRAVGARAARRLDRAAVGTRRHARVRATTCSATSTATTLRGGAHRVTRRPKPSILHVDLDAFYASVEQLDDPALVGTPGDRRRPRTARRGRGRELRGARASVCTRRRRWCGRAGRVPTACSSRRVRPLPRRRAREIMAILKSFTPLVEPISLDEAFLDVAGARRIHGTGPESRSRSARGCSAETGLTASVGVATTKLLAKLASDLAKPDGLLVVEPGTELDVPAPARRSAALGRRAGDRAQARPTSASRTVGELAALPEEHRSCSRSGARHGRHLHALAWNRDERAPVEPTSEVASRSATKRRSPSTSTTTPRSTTAWSAAGRRRGVAPAAGGRHRPHRPAQGALRRLPHRSPARARLPNPPTSPPTSPRSPAPCSTRSTSAAGVRLLGVSVQQLAVHRTGHRRQPGVRRSEPRPTPPRRRRPARRRSSGRSTAGPPLSGRSTRSGPGSVLVRRAPVAGASLRGR